MWLIDTAFFSNTKILKVFYVKVSFNLVLISFIEVKFYEALITGENGRIF